VAESELMRSTIVKNVRQIDLFMQNKANSCKAKINVPAALSA
jgi:hypothetical protein